MIETQGCGEPAVVKEIRAYWELALAPYWPRIQALLEADIFHRSRQIAEHGVRLLLNDLHGTLSWDAGALRLARRPRALSDSMPGTGLLLFPTAFAASNLYTRVRSAEPLQVAYPARGAGMLWAARPTADTSALAAVLGRSRTLLLVELENPASTTDLAGRTGMSPPGVSQHLSALRHAGLVSAHRAGRSVLYARTAAADVLLGAGSG